MIKRRSWKVHAYMRCENCGKEWGNHFTAVSLAQRHALRHQHRVSGETGYHVEYEPSQFDLFGREVKNG